MRFLNLKTLGFLFVLAVSAFGLLSCSTAGVLLKTAPSSPKGAPAYPAIAADSLSAWEGMKDKIKADLQTDVYGTLPTDFTTELVSSKTIEGHSYNAIIEERRLRTWQTVDPAIENAPEGNRLEIIYNAVIVKPANISGPVPVIMLENFCPNHNVIPVEGISLPERSHFSCDGKGLMSKVFGYFFGRYIVTPPIEDIVSQGYGLAVIFPGDNYPDRAGAFAPFMKYAPDQAQPWGAIGAWAFMFSSLNHHLKADEGFGETIAYGHSRYGKSAIVAAAYDSSIDAVISHQSGTGGASLSRDKKGETVEAIMRDYPHWFSSNFNPDNEQLDQHHLLALIAPRPILLGNAERDVWSDPEGAFRASQGADKVYELYGKQGLNQKKLTDYQAASELAFWIRSGTHGIVKEDWPAFLNFLDAHIK